MQDRNRSRDHRPRTYTQHDADRTTDRAIAKVFILVVALVIVIGYAMSVRSQF